MIRIESMLSARLFTHPQRVGNRLYFLSNMSGQISLYAMNWGGSIPEPLLPPQIALQNPDLMGGVPYFVFPHLGKILVMIDKDGDENYQPMWIPLEGGIPEPAFPELADTRVACNGCDLDDNVAYLVVQSRQEAINTTYFADLKNNKLEKIAAGEWGKYPAGNNEDHTLYALIDGYTVGDNTLYLARKGQEPTVLYGKPLEDRAEGEQVPLNSIGACFFVNNDQGLLFTTSLFEDAYGLGYLELSKPGEAHQVKITGQVHQGAGEMEALTHLHDHRFEIKYNIDGASWLYEGAFDVSSRTMHLDKVIVGQGELANGVLTYAYYEEAAGGYSLSFSTATSPSQLYTVDGDKIQMHTCERILGIPQAYFAPGEDASFISHDGLRISARLYLPAPALGYEGARPLVYYIHGGPQSQEKPDFTWFSMPLIQFLTMRGFAVFVPNVRGSTGYGLSYTKHVDRDWGGQDRLDHVHAMTKVLSQDKRIDVSRAGVVGRSYGGYMTLTLASRHPELWKGAIDMFGPYDLHSFMDRIPETWKPYFAIAVGHPEKDRDFLVERSPRTYIHQMTCPMLVIQGKNDPRVVEAESRDVVEQLRAQGKQIDYLMFEDEGHDVLKFKNRVACYNAITDFFADHL